jgi:acyl-coenzyme A thioesterase PaaI-like protein
MRISGARSTPGKIHVWKMAIRDDQDAIVCTSRLTLLVKRY